MQVGCFFLREMGSPSLLINTSTCMASCVGSWCALWRRILEHIHTRTAPVLPLLKIARISKEPIKEINYFLFDLLPGWVTVGLSMSNPAPESIPSALHSWSTGAVPRTCRGSCLELLAWLVYLPDLTCSSLQEGTTDHYFSVSSQLVRSIHYSVCTFVSYKYSEWDWNAFACWEMCIFHGIHWVVENSHTPQETD